MKTAEFVKNEFLNGRTTLSVPIIAREFDPTTLRVVEPNRIIYLFDDNSELIDNKDGTLHVIHSSTRLHKQ